MKLSRRDLLAAPLLLPIAERLSAMTPPPDLASLDAPHFAEGRFFHPWGVAPRGFGDFLRWQLSSKSFDKRRPLDIPRLINDGRSLARPIDGAELTWVGHATYAIHDEGDVVLTDPHFGPRAFLPPRLSPPGVPIAAIPEGAVALLSHNHYDHLDEWTIERLGERVAWYVPLGLGRFVRDHGAREVHELDWWQSARRGRWTFTAVPAQHWSRRVGQPQNSTLWCGWVADGGARRYYFAGDSGYFHGLAEIGRRFAPLDVAILPIGAYEPRWFMGAVHMNPADALQAFADLGARFLLPMHWGCFDLTDEPADLAPQVLRQLIADRGLDATRLPILAVGESWPVRGHEPKDS